LKGFTKLRVNFHRLKDTMAVKGTVDTAMESDKIKEASKHVQSSSSK